MFLLRPLNNPINRLLGLGYHMQQCRVNEKIGFQYDTIPWRNDVGWFPNSWWKSSDFSSFPRGCAIGIGNGRANAWWVISARQSRSSNKSNHVSIYRTRNLRAWVLVPGRTERESSNPCSNISCSFIWRHWPHDWSFYSSWTPTKCHQLNGKLNPLLSQSVHIILIKKDLI